MTDDEFYEMIMEEITKPVRRSARDGKWNCFQMPTEDMVDTPAED